MKLRNFFKKNSVKNTSNKQVLSKDQLEKIIGGVETDTTTPVEPMDPLEAGRVGKPKYGNISL